MGSSCPGKPSPSTSSTSSTLSGSRSDHASAKGSPGNWRTKPPMASSSTPSTNSLKTTATSTDWPSALKRRATGTGPEGLKVTSKGVPCRVSPARRRPPSPTAMLIPHQRPPPKSMRVVASWSRSTVRATRTATVVPWQSCSARYLTSTSATSSRMSTGISMPVKPAVAGFPTAVPPSGSKQASSSKVMASSGC